MDSDLLQDVIALLRNQIGQEEFKNLEDTCEDDAQTEKLTQISDLDTDASSYVESGSKISEASMLRRAIRYFVNNMRSEVTNFNTSLTRSIYEMKKATEQMQQYAELYNEIQLDSCHLKDFLSVIKATTQMDVTGNSIQFRAKWKAYIIISLTHLLLMLNEYKVARDASKYVIFWLQQNIGAEARTTNLHGFACHILAIIHQAQNNHESTVQYYESAWDAYQGDYDWIDANARKNLIQVTDAKLESVDASIGTEGGRLGLNSFQVQIPQDALCDTKQFNLRTSLVVNYDEDYTPISAVLECEPPTNFKSAVKIALPIWCEVESENVIAEVFCLSNKSSKPELLESVDLRNVKEAVTFDSKHFSLFFMMIKNTLLQTAKFKVTMRIWKDNEGNYNFILAAKDKTVKKKWCKDLISRGYSPTKVIINPTVVKNEQELTVTMTCDKGNFTRSRQKLKPNFNQNLIFHKNFVLKLEKSGLNVSSKTFTCEVMSQDTLIDEVQWSENVISIGVQSVADQRFGFTPITGGINSDISDSDCPRIAYRLEDVFQDEIVKQFTSNTMWRRFAISSFGLGLSMQTYNTIKSNNPCDVEGQKMAMLEWWQYAHSSVLDSDGTDTIIRIRRIVKEFLEREQRQ